MPRITFTQDVTLDDQPEGTGPHYRRGYCPEVNDHEAQKWIKKGVAEYGEVQLTQPAKECPAPDITQESEPEPFDIPTFKKRRAKRFE